METLIEKNRPFAWHMNELLGDLPWWMTLLMVQMGVGIIAMSLWAMLWLPWQARIAVGLVHYFFLSGALVSLYSWCLWHSQELLGRVLALVITLGGSGLGLIVARLVYRSGCGALGSGRMTTLAIWLWCVGLSGWLAVYLWVRWLQLKGKATFRVLVREARKRRVHGALVLVFGVSLLPMGLLADWVFAVGSLTMALLLLGNIYVFNPGDSDMTRHIATVEMRLRMVRLATVADKINANAIMVLDTAFSEFGEQVLDLVEKLGLSGDDLVKLYGHHCNQDLDQLRRLLESGEARVLLAEAD